MTTVTLRAFKQQSRYQRMAHEGHAVLVTYRGKPYFVAGAPSGERTFVGSARAGRPLRETLLDSVLPDDDWTATR